MVLVKKASRSTVGTTTVTPSLDMSLDNSYSFRLQGRCEPVNVMCPGTLTFYSLATREPSCAKYIWPFGKKRKDANESMHSSLFDEPCPLAFLDGFWNSTAAGAYHRRPTSLSLQKH